MGSWYKTCGLSQLPIIDNEEVMVFVLEKNKDTSDRCYSTAFWSPVLVPFYSKYGDYGRGVEDSGAALPYIMDSIKQSLLEVELGDNKYHDIEIKRSNFDIELFYEAVHENRLYKQGHTDNILIDFVMIRKDIADDILANFGREMYVGSGKGDCGYDNAYKKVTFANIVADLPDFMAKLNEMFVPKDIEESEELRLSLMDLKFMSGLSGVFNHEDTNLVGKWMRGVDDYKYSQLVRMSETVMDLMQAGKVVEATEFMIDLLKGLYINCYMESSRRNWAPAGHEGSQNREMHGYRVLAEATLRALDREKAQWLEDTGEDEEEYSEF